MAGSAVVGALRVSLGLDSASFTTGLKSAQTGLQRFGSMAKAGALAIGAAMVAAGTAVGIAMKGMIDEADKMSKLSQSIGVPIDELSRLRYAAELADVDIDKLGKALLRLSVNMLESTQSATGVAARSFTMLGVSVKDATGAMKPASEMVAELADRFQRMPDGVEKTAIAVGIFGKAGADMIPLLNAGGEGLREMYAEAEQLGLVLDKETGQAAEAFNDNLTRLGKVQDGIVTKITAAMLPALLKVSEFLVKASNNAELMSGVGAALGWTLKGLATVVIGLGGAFYATAVSISAAADASGKFWRGDWIGAAAAAAGGLEKLKEGYSTVKDMIVGLWSDIPSTPPPALPRTVTELNRIDAAARSAAAGVDELTDAEKEAIRAAEELAREGKRTFDQTRTPAEQYAARIEELRRQLVGAAIDQDTFNRAMRDAQDAFDSADPGKQAERALQEKVRDYQNQSQLDAIALADDHQRYMEAATYDGIRGGLEAAADGNLGQYLASRIRSALFDGLADSLTSMFTGGKGKKGGGLFGSIGALFGIKLPGFKTGGSFKVGGAGGPDSQITAFKATPGEMVDIRKPGQSSGGSVSFDLRGAVMTADLLAQMQQMAAQTGGMAYVAGKADQASAMRSRRQSFL